MSKSSGRFPTQPSLLNENSGGGPWGGRGGGSGGGDGGGPRNPWSQPPEGGKPRGNRPSGATALDELLKKSRDRFGGGLPPSASGKPLIMYGVIAVVALWLLFTSIHRIGPQEAGVVTRFGSYAGTLRPGISLTLPAPIDNVTKIDVEGYRTVDIGGGGNAENLMLTGDQNLVDLAYSVSWNVSSPERFLFQLAEPEETIREVAESAMRAVIANVSLQDAIGSGRAAIEQQVAARMQELLDSYNSGIDIQVVAIKQADPPAAVIEAFKEVSSAQQTAQTYLNEARAYAQQLSAKAQGEAAAFDKVYEEYRLAPEVTRRRMYYETMEDVLSRVDKTIVEAEGVTPYLPLPQVQRQAQRPQAEAGR